jgi:hypothetical protein
VYEVTKIPARCKKFSCKNILLKHFLAAVVLKISWRCKTFSSTVMRMSCAGTFLSGRRLVTVFLLILLFHFYISAAGGAIRRKPG